MAFHRRTAWIAGASLLLVSSTLLADGQGGIVSPKQAIARLFFSYPAISLPANEPQWHLRRHAAKYFPDPGRPYYGVLSDYYGAPARRNSAYANLAAASYSSALSQASEALARDEVQPVNPLASTNLPRYRFDLQSDAQSGTSNSGDEWRFTANPIFNMNHAHERGASFSLRHDF